MAEASWQTVWRLHGARAPSQPFVVLRHLDESETASAVAGLVPGEYKVILYCWSEDAAGAAAGETPRKPDSALAAGGRSLLKLLSLGRLGKLEVRGELRVSALQAGTRLDVLEHIFTLSIDSRPSVEVNFEVSSECAAAEVELLLSSTSFMTPIKVSAQLYRRSGAAAKLADSAEARSGRDAGREDADNDAERSTDLMGMHAARLRARDRRARGTEAAAVFIGCLLGASSYTVLEILFIVLCLLLVTVNAREDLLLSLVNKGSSTSARTDPPRRFPSSDSTADAGAGPAAPALARSARPHLKLA
jgi:hypothetical protein